MCEIDQRDLQPQKKYPSPDYQMPSHLNPTAGLHVKQGPNLQTLNHVTLSSPDAAEAVHLGWQERLASLLDRLLFVIGLPDSNKETKLAELAELDSKIRNFLEIFMGGLERQNTICAYVALCHR